MFFLYLEGSSVAELSKAREAAKFGNFGYGLLTYREQRFPVQHADVVVLIFLCGLFEGRSGHFAGQGTERLDSQNADARIGLVLQYPQKCLLDLLVSYHLLQGLNGFQSDACVLVIVKGGDEGIPDLVVHPTSQ